MTPANNTRFVGPRSYSDRDLIEACPFLADLVGEGAWRDAAAGTPADEPWDEGGLTPSLSVFRREFRKISHDAERALLILRRLRVKTLLALARADLEDRVKPHQLRARLKGLSEVLVQGAWLLAENGLRERYVHPLILERRNINPPLAICSLSRLGAGEPWYTTGPAPIFVHSRAAEFAPALTEKDFAAARRSGKEWPPARDYFHRLARRTMSFLSVPDPAGKGFDHMAEDYAPDRVPILPGALVVLFSAFEEHFSGRRPVKERLALLRLRFLVGQDRLGRAVEAAARGILLRTAAELGSRLKAGLNAWYRDRAVSEGLPLTRGGLLDIERGVRLVQFRHAAADPKFLEPSPLKSLDALTEAGVINGDERLILTRSYAWQWFLVNRMALLGRRAGLDREALGSGRLDAALGLEGASERTIRMMKSAQGVLSGLVRETGRERAALTL
ncbi:MAG: hypothetical protein V1816_08595 [Pseudomonadota bacterium]